MAKIHTHYDNLKVARKAPQEVIRAAYKALSQKYHPDKNPGDEKAARIMAILNSAYGTLSDPLRRREHDDWIAAEEWEIAWLESTHAEDNRELLNHDTHAWQADSAELAPPAPTKGRWWLALVLGLLVGTGGAVLVMSQWTGLPADATGAIGFKPDPAAAAPVAVAPEPPAKRDAAPPDQWAVAQAHLPDAAQRPPEVMALATTQLVIPARAPDCEAELHTLVAPNGEPWPAESGYLPAYPMGNQGSGMQISVDNSGNSSPVLVKVVDLERAVTVRHLYVLAHEAMTIDQLTVGRYEVRYQNVQVGGSRDECLVRRKRAPLQDAVVQAVP